MIGIIKILPGGGIYRFSVWTPTYNHGNLLQNVYNCLLIQKYKDFEWIIVDDGSDDDTEMVCNEFLSKASFPITYIKQENGGKHTAWRQAIKYFKGKYVVTCDSDDELLPEALSIFNKYWTDLEKQQDYDEYWEVKGMVINQDGIVLGEDGIPFDNGIFDSDYNTLTYKMHFKSEMHACRKATVLREYGIPSFPYENMCSNFSEGILWSRIARKYKSRFIKDVIRIYNQGMPGSLTARTASNPRLCYNSLVMAIYKNDELRDLMWKYEKREYFLNLIVLIYNSLRLHLSPWNKVNKLHKIDSIVVGLFYLPVALLRIIRK